MGRQSLDSRGSTSTHNKTMETLGLINLLIVSALMMCTVESLQCYNCGYRKVNGGDPEDLPEMTYCNNFAKPTDIVTNCTQPGDCCASMKELIERKEENGNTTYTELIAKHGCGSDIGEIEGRHHYCNEHPNSCFNVDDSTFPKPNETAVVTDIEVCFCSTDRCNEENPIFPEPAPGGSAVTVASIILVSVGAFIVGL